MGTGKKGLWVASTGGHLEQLVRISNLSSYRGDSVWVTFDNQQSRSLLGNKRRVYVDYVRPRDLYKAMKAAWQVLPTLRSESFDFCISTGAAVATFILPLSRICGARAIYIESVSRTAGPSLTGRIMATVPGVETYTQHSSWNLKKWTYIGSLLDKWTVSNSTPIERPLKVFVTLGTIKPYVFERAVDAVLEILRPSDSVVWQLGTSWRDGLPGESFRELTSEEVDFNIRHADVVITHAGVGSIINILDAGSSPVLAIRKKRYNEHIDDHQQQIADTMVKRGLAQALDLERPDRSTLLTAAYRTVETRSNDE